MKIIISSSLPAMSRSQQRLWHCPQHLLQLELRFQYSYMLKQLSLHLYYECRLVGYPILMIDCIDMPRDCGLSALAQLDRSTSHHSEQWCCLADRSHRQQYLFLKKKKFIIFVIIFYHHNYQSIKASTYVKDRY